jgi:hypothetical protein
VRQPRDLNPVDPHDFYTTDEGQDKLIQMHEERCKSRRAEIADQGLSVMDYANAPSSSMPAYNGWIELDLTADTGACDSVVPKDGPLSSIAIVPSWQSENGLSYEVANKATIPCLGERRLEMWTEGASASRCMAVQVADVHKPLLSLGRCADAGFESRFGKRVGCLIDSTNGEIVPMQRRGNLYYLKCWVRAAPIASDSRFGGQR